MEVKIRWWNFSDGRSAQSDDKDAIIQEKCIKTNKYFVAGLVSAPYGVWDSTYGDSIVSIYLPENLSTRTGRNVNGKRDINWCKMSCDDVRKIYISKVLCKESDQLRIGDICIDYENSCRYFRPPNAEHSQFVKGIEWFRDNIDDECSFDIC